MPAFEEGEWTNARGDKLYTVQFLPDDMAPVAVLVVHHGIGEHVRRYDVVFNTLASEGIAVHAFDCHGHGRSESTDTQSRFLVAKFQHLIDDFVGFTRHARKQHPPSVPLFAAGHSMGGLVAVESVLQEPTLCSGLLLSAAALYVEFNTTLRVQAAISGVLSAIAPNMRMVPAIVPSELNPEPELVEAYITDPLIDHGKMKIRTARELLVAMREVEHSGKHLALPLLAIHGVEDKTTSPQGTRRLVEQCSSSDKTLIEVPGGYHEMLMNPRHRDELVATMVAWVKQRSATAKL